MECSGLRVPDVDVEDKARSDAMFDLAEKHFPGAPMRSRSNSNRFAITLRAAEGEPSKRAIKGPILGYDPETGKPIQDGVEILGRGNQLHVFGIHPSGAELKWDGPAPGDEPVENLQAVTEDQITAFLAEAAKIIGAEPEEAPAGAQEQNTGAPRVQDCISERRLRGHLAFTPPCDRRDWHKIIRAIAENTVLKADGTPMEDDERCHLPMIT
jgi:hypothetical protein